MTTQKDRERLRKMIGENAHAVHRNPDRNQRNARSGHDRNSDGNAGKRSAWGGGGKLITGDVQKQISIQFTFKESGAHIVQFNFSPPIQEVGVLTVFPVSTEALITWETNGNTVVRRVSVVDGCTVQGSGESVKIVVYDTTPGAIAIGKEYDVSISVGPGTRGSFTNPPILFEDGGAVHAITAGNNPLVLAVPEDAGVNSVLVTVATLSGLPLTEQGIQVSQQTGLAVNGGIVLAVYDCRALAFAPLLPGCRLLSIRNQRSGTETIRVQAIWGIDG